MGNNILSNNLSKGLVIVTHDSKQDQFVANMYHRLDKIISFIVYS